MTKAQRTFEKVAKYLDISDIEDAIGTYANDEYEPMIRGAITKAENSSLPLRHPILTGIPTLGIAPAVAKNNAIDKITRQLARRDVGIANSVQDRRDKIEQRALRQQELAVKRDEANRYRNAVNAGASALLKARLQQAAMQAADNRYE